YDTTTRRPAPPAGDHAAFSEIEIPAVAYTVNDLEILHTAEDVYEDSKRDSSVLLAALAQASLEVSHPPS
ncbi:MAG: hypothetical protein M3Y06_07755, partial [Actinomycetota bacterium]|nr:hypothetical protein [Actinomycetota bacterium]